MRSFEYRTCNRLGICAVDHDVCNGYPRIVGANAEKLLSENRNHRLAEERGVEPSYESTHTPSGDRCAPGAHESIATRAQRDKVVEASSKTTRLPQRGSGEGTVRGDPTLDIPLAVRLRDEEGPRLPQMMANRRAQLENEAIARHNTLRADVDNDGPQLAAYSGSIRRETTGITIIHEPLGYEFSKAEERAAHTAGRKTARSLLACQHHKFSADYVAMAVVQDALAAIGKVER